MNSSELEKSTPDFDETKTMNLVYQFDTSTLESTPVSAHLTTLIEEYHSLNPRLLPFLSFPTPLEFCKQVSKGLPCVYSLPPGRRYCPAQSWTRSQLVNTVVESVEVAITPDGHADALHEIHSETEPVFLQPANIHMSMSSLLEKLDQTQKTHVYYLQSQNGNLNSDTPLTPLLKDLPKNISFAEDILGSPEAINIWIGTSASVTSTHRDPYENLYLVLKGSKTFTLYAPVDEVALCSQQVCTGRFVYDADEKDFSVEMDHPPAKIPWIPIDPLLPYEELVAKYPMYRYAQPQRVRVQEGQILYLPAGFFHHVEQDSGTWDDGSIAPCIAVNYWYDQDYEGEKYVMRQHIGRLAQQIQDETADKRKSSETNDTQSTSRDEGSG